MFTMHLVVSDNIPNYTTLALHADFINRYETPRMYVYCVHQL